MHIKKQNILKLSSLLLVSNLFVGCMNSVPEPWKQAGFQGYESICGIDWQCWQKSGFTPEEAKQWRNLYFSRDEAIQLKREGYTLHEIQEWHKLGITRISTIKRYRSYNINAKQYHELPLLLGTKKRRLLHELKEIRENNLTLEDIKKYHTLTFKDNKDWKYKIIRLLKEYNISLQDAKKFDENGFFLRYYGLVHYRFELWSEDGFSADEAIQWSKAGFSPSLYYSKYERNHRIYNAKRWKDAGYTLKQAKHLVKLHINNQKYFKVKNFKKELDSYHQYNLKSIQAYNKFIKKFKQEYPYYIQAIKVNFINGESSINFNKNTIFETIPNVKIFNAVMLRQNKGISYYSDLVKRYKEQSFYGMKNREEYSDLHNLTEVVYSFTNSTFLMENSIIPLKTKKVTLMTNIQNNKLDSQHKINFTIKKYLYGNYLYDIKAIGSDRYYIKNIVFGVFSLKNHKIIKRFTISPKNNTVTLKVNY